MIYKDEWINVIKLRKSNPKSFMSPSVNDLMNIKYGDNIRISNRLERFFVKVVSIDFDRNKIIGCVNNNLFVKKPYNYGCFVSFRLENIFEIYDTRRALEIYTKVYFDLIVENNMEKLNAFCNNIYILQKNINII